TPLPAVEEHLETFLAQVELETRTGLPAFVKEDFDTLFSKGVSISCSMLSIFRLRRTGEDQDYPAIWSPRLGRLTT
ncbi:MAG: hypothetical protein ACREYC_23625, partial [Gammaproteobacteria bacterium]